MSKTRTKKSGADYRRETAETRAFLWRYHVALCKTLGIDPEAHEPRNVVAYLAGRLDKPVHEFAVSAESAPGAS